MLDRLTANLDFHGNALMLRADRQRVIAANIANADTPGYQARDQDFAAALASATGYRTAGGAISEAGGGAFNAAALVATDPRHLGPGGAPAGSTALLYRVPEQAAGDANTVDMDRERANFADNAVRYEATLRFVNGSVRTSLSAIRGE